MHITAFPPPLIWVQGLQIGGTSAFTFWPGFFNVKNLDGMRFVAPMLLMGKLRLREI